MAVPFIFKIAQKNASNRCHKTKGKNCVSETEFNYKALIVAAMSIALIGCGGGGGGGTSGGISGISGQAVIGAPMSKASIVVTSLVDATNGQATADEDGAFKVPSGVSYPAIVKATSVNGAQTHWGYIASASQTQIAVNPLTSVLLALAQGGHPSTITSPMSAPTLAAAKTKLNTVINQVVSQLGISTGDFLTTTFASNHTGIDLLLDVIGFDLVDNGSITVINRVEGGSQSVSSSSATALPFSTNSNAISNSRLSECATAVASITSANLIDPSSTIYDSSFKQSGANRPAYQLLVSDLVAGTGGFKAMMPTYRGEDGNGNLLFSAVLVNTSTLGFIADHKFTMKWNSVSNRCLFVGDQYPFNISVEPAIKRIIRLDSYATNYVNHHVPTPVNGIEIQIGAFDSDPSDRANTITGLWWGTPVNSVRVDVCSALSTCTNLATLSRQPGKTGANDKGTFLIDGSNYAFMNMKDLSSGSILTSRKNPIRVSFFSTTTAPSTSSDFTNQVGASQYVKPMGDLFSTAEFNSVLLPSVSSSGQTSLTAFTDSPTYAFDSGSGILESFTRQSFDGSSVISKSTLPMKKGTGTVSLTSSDLSSAVYRSIIMKAKLPSRPGILETKYIYAPSMQGAY